MGTGSLIALKPRSWKRLLVPGYMCPPRRRATLGLHLLSPILRAARVEGGSTNQPCGIMASGGHRPLGAVSNSLPAAQGSPKSILSTTNPPRAAGSPTVRAQALGKASVLLTLLQLYVTQSRETINEPRC